MFEHHRNHRSASEPGSNTETDAPECALESVEPAALEPGDPIDPGDSIDLGELGDPIDPGDPGKLGDGFLRRLSRPFTWLGSRIGGYFAARSPRYLAGAFATALAVAILLLPSPYVIEMPGPTQDVLGRAKGDEVIAVSGEGVTTYKDPGSLLLVTVSASGVPGYTIINAQAVWGWADPNVDVTPREAVVPVGQTADEYQKKVDGDMTGSQDSASAVGLRYVRKHADELGVDAATLKRAKVTMHVDSIGGPSAGMMYTLGLIDKLTPAEESGGATIAGTGTIGKNGKVGEIGGIRLKMIGAQRDGATWFLAPEANCDDVVGHVPQGLRDVKVATLDEAYQALVAIGKGQADDLPHCTA